MEKVKMIAKLEEMCRKYDRKDYPGIAVAVVENGETIFSKGYGEANLEYNIPIDENTVFHACSMTKQFTATCNVKIDNVKLFVSNNNLHNNALDLYYTFATKDTFISDNNRYNGNRRITFSRNSNNEIVSFSYGDDEQNLRENFIFMKIK